MWSVSNISIIAIIDNISLIIILTDRVLHTDGTLSPYGHVFAVNSIEIV